MIMILTWNNYCQGCVRVGRRWWWGQHCWKKNSSWPWVEAFHWNRHPHHLYLQCLNHHPDLLRSYCSQVLVALSQCWGSQQQRTHTGPCRGWGAFALIFRKMNNNNNKRRNKQTTQISTDSCIKNKRKMDNNNNRRNKQTTPISTDSSIKNKIPERLSWVPLEQANKAMASHSVGD